MSASRPSIVYVINSFDRGGAEAGLVALVEGGLFAGCRLEIVALVRGHGGPEQRLLALGYEPHVLVDRARMGLRDMPRIFVRLWRLIRRSQPQIVIASLPQANLLARLSVLFQRATTFVSFEHNTHLAKRIYEIGYRLTSWRVDWSFADAESTLRTAHERLYRRAPPKQAVIPLVSFATAAQEVRARAPNRPFHVVNAGRFTLPKNQSALIEAVGLLRGSKRDVVLSLYGEGPERARCEALAARLGVADCVRFPGFVQDWPSRPGDLFVLASRHEGLCLVALEAMHAGLPVAAPLVGGVRDYAEPGVLHELPSVEPETVARAVAVLMDDPARREAIADAAAQMVERRFAAAQVRKIYAEVNAALLARSKPDGGRGLEERADVLRSPRASGAGIEAR